jgi:hypothetical protein
MGPYSCGRRWLRSFPTPFQEVRLFLSGRLFERLPRGVAVRVIQRVINAEAQLQAVSWNRADTSLCDVPSFVRTHRGSPTITGSRSVTAAPSQAFARPDDRRAWNGVAVLGLADSVTPFDFNQILNARRICSEALIPSRSHNACICANRSSSIRNVMVRLIGVIRCNSVTQVLQPSRDPRKWDTSGHDAQRIGSQVRRH